MSDDSADEPPAPPHIEAELAETLRILRLADDAVSQPEQPLEPEPEGIREQRPMGAPSSLEPGMKIGPFTVLHQLGTGGQADVYAVYDPRLNRKVALKLIRLGPELRSRTQNERLMREAQALARLEHPNVVRVHDAGMFEGAAYLVMEIKPGDSLHKWLARPRRWQEIVEKFVAAGRGLHAAHQAGIVHRDFKAENVFIDSYFGAVLGDFGLALITVEPVSNASETEPETGASEARAPLTDAEHRLGTEGYIAPECARGRATARSDQYSFCVALHLALFGRMPRAGVNALAIRGKVRAPLVRALQRGLADDPAARFPDMAALLAALTARPRRTLAIVASAAAAAAVLGFTWVAQAATQERCVSQGREQFAAVWDEARRAEVDTAITGLELPFGARASESLQGFADRYGEAWTKARAGLCTIPNEAREACLSRQLERFAGVVALYAKPDRESVTRMLDVLGGLDLPAACERPEASSLTGTPDWLRDYLDRLELRIVAGDYAGAGARTGVALDASSPYKAAHARAVYLTGWLDASARSSREALDRLQAGALLAVEAGDYDTFARASTLRLKSLAFDLGEHGEAALQAPWIRSTMTALPTDSPIRRRFEAEFAEAEGLRLDGQGEHAKAAAQHLEGLAQREALFGAEHPTTSKSHHNLGLSLANLSRTLSGRERGAQFDEAREHYLRAVQIRQAALGEDHPQTVESRAGLAEMECEYMLDFVARDPRGLEECVGELERVRDRYRQGDWDLRAAHRRSRTYASFAVWAECIDCADEALREVFEGMKHLSEVDPRETADMWALRGLVASRRKQHETAEAHFLESAAVLEAAGARGWVYSQNLHNAAGAALEGGRPDAAVRLMLDRGVDMANAACPDRQAYAEELDGLAGDIAAVHAYDRGIAELRQAAAAIRRECS
ncbi:serine/threonine-protein kinase [Nannocystis bainbridge]|uniref:Protein kinase n=1 Tax=Nannocystis bainbridge TaxID=2995303 RepID=A0ABT5E8L5_9BACT|nr:protein kinase [Nannocystis bainbridge]MDC0721980.1 protein kinase [Nannocystis bainbridge]